MDDPEEAPLVLNQEPELPADNMSARHSHQSINSSRTSIMGDSVMYNDHLTEHARERKNEHMSHLQSQITIYGVLFTIFLTTTLLCHGWFNTETSLVATTGCAIALPVWFIGLTALCLVKLLIESGRFYLYHRHSEESMVLHLGGNFVIMPILFAVFFGFTQHMAF